MTVINNPNEHPEFVALMEKARSLTPEQLAELEQSHAEHLKCFHEWVAPLLLNRITGAQIFRGWVLKENPYATGSFVLDHGERRLRVMISGGVYGDGRRWLHLSVSHRERVPDWDELKAVKSEFMGDRAHAVQVFPPKDQWVNDHPYCLHLWHCLDGEPLPDFRHIIGPIASL